ncbi:hypothetical protein EDD17DRAFT_1426639, partial [Pisolithus thermaeus]
LGTLGRAQHIERALQTVLGRCCICLVRGNQEGSSGKHELMHCPALSSFGAYREWRQKLRYRRHHGMICYICHV